MLLTIQPDLVRKDMRHETRLFFYRITMDTPLDELRDGGHGFCPQRVESMVQGIFIPFVVDPQTFPEYAISSPRLVRCPDDPSLEGPSFEGWPGFSQSGLIIFVSS